MLLITQDCSSIESRVMPRSLSSDTNDAMYLLFDISLVVLGAMIFWYRERLGRSMARLQQEAGSDAGTRPRERGAASSFQS
jgi:hypothetical protein